MADVIGGARGELEGSRMAPRKAKSTDAGLTLAQVVEGFTLDAQARRLAPGTLADYGNSLRRLTRELGPDRPFAEIGTAELRAFMAGLARPQTPEGIAPRPERAVGKKQALNIHTGLCALWTWAVAEGIASEHMMRAIQRPRPEQRAVQPFSLADVRALLEACERTRVYERPGKRACDNERPTSARDRAIILLLLDTGIRASELCGIRIRDLDVRNRAVMVMGKGSKERWLPASGSTVKAVWKYTAAVRKCARLDDALFLSYEGRPLTRTALLKVLASLGAKAGVEDCHPHRFRHTFAIQYLRNGGNVLALQASLGHASLEMVRRYARLAQADLENGHRVASPVEGWRL
jgi:integrase/recombinase XerD